MKRAILAVLCVCAVAFAQENRTPRQRITTTEIQSAEVIGSLGEPLGTCVRIRATILKGDKTKADGGWYFLKITQVKDHELPLPVVSSFEVHRFATREVKVVGNDFELFTLKTGKKATSPSEQQMVELERDYVGTSIDLIVYETGRFRGIPRNLPKKVGPWQDYGYGFATTVMVMDQL